MEDEYVEAHDLPATWEPIVWSPAGIVFDGANLWVTDDVLNRVGKIRPSDGTLLATYVPGNGPWGLTFDGLNIWVCNQYDNTVTKFRASDGTTLGTFPTGVDPLFAAFDGANVWVTNHTSGTVSTM